MYALQYITENNFANKVIILRLDLNVPVANGKITDNSRITRVIPTIKYLRNQGAKLVIITHFGRPCGRKEKSFSVEFLVPILTDLLQEAISFANDMQIDKHAGITLLENIRFYHEEEQNDYSFAKKLAKLGDVYINDAFACCHRKHASIVAITKFLSSYAGLLIQQELNFLSNIATKTPVIAIIGGKKISTKFDVMVNLAHKVQYIAVGGAMVNSFISALGKPIGKSYHEPELIQQTKDFIASKKACNIILPSDVVVDRDGKTVILNIDAIQPNDIIYDIGPVSVINLCKIITKCNTLLWNGPLGFFENSRFAAATQFLANFIAKDTQDGNIASIAGGGDIVAALNVFGVSENFSYISTAGGAFLEWLEGTELPGITALLQ